MSQERSYEVSEGFREHGLVISGDKRYGIEEAESRKTSGSDRVARSI